MRQNIFERFEKKRRDGEIVLDKSSSTATPNNDTETFEERAAIMEYDGKLTRQEAERKAVGNNRYVQARIVRCHTCLRYGPKDRYCGHKLRHIQADEREICAGRGYSPKGSPWKELRS